MLSLAELSAPYLFTNTLNPGGDPGLMVLTSLTAKVGVVNVNPLTTLLTAQLLGLDPSAVINSYGSGTSVPKDRITEASIRAAQADLTAFLQDVVGIQVKSGSASFIDATFKTDVGDPMYDTILALNEKLATEGTTLKDLATRIATGVHACDVEQIQVTVNGAQKKFCPISKGAVPEKADPSIVDYVFQNNASEVLTAKAQGSTVLSIDFQTTASTTYSCAGSACSSASLGAATDDGSRTLSFASVALTGVNGSAMLNGSLIGPPPSITLPTLPCLDNRYFLILSTNTVIADCISASDPFQLGGNFSSPSSPGRELVYFSNTDDPLPSAPRIEMVLDTSTATPTIVSIYFVDRDPETNEIRNRFLCRIAACNAVEVGPPTTTTTPGFPVEMRTITFNNTLLTGLKEDGTETGVTGSFRGSFLLLRLPGQESVYPPLMDCDPAADTISAHGFGGAEFNICVPPNDLVNQFFYRQTFDFGGGDEQLYLFNDMFDQISVFLHDGALVRAEVQLSSVPEQFVCSMDCTGVIVSGPDGNGDRTVTFSNAVLYHMESYPLPGDRTLTLTSGDLVVPPP